MHLLLGGGAPGRSSWEEPRWRDDINQLVWEHLGEAVLLPWRPTEQWLQKMDGVAVLYVVCIVVC